MAKELILDVVGNLLNGNFTRIDRLHEITIGIAKTVQQVMEVVDEILTDNDTSPSVRAEHVFPIVTFCNAIPPKSIEILINVARGLVVGSYEEVLRHIQALKDAQSFFEHRRSILIGFDSTKITQGITEAINSIDLSLVEKIDEYLRENKFEIDPETSKIKKLTGRGRPEELLSLLVRELDREYNQHYPMRANIAPIEQRLQLSLLISPILNWHEKAMIEYRGNDSAIALALRKTYQPKH